MATLMKPVLEIAAVMRQPDVVERFRQLSVNPVVVTSEAFAALLAREIPIWKDVARKANIKSE